MAQSVHDNLATADYGLEPYEALQVDELHKLLTGNIFFADVPDPQSVDPKHRPYTRQSLVTNLAAPMFAQAGVNYTDEPSSTRPFRFASLLASLNKLASHYSSPSKVEVSCYNGKGDDYHKLSCKQFFAIILTFHLYHKETRLALEFLVNNQIIQKPTVRTQPHIPPCYLQLPIMKHFLSLPSTKVHTQHKRKPPQPHIPTKQKTQTQDLHNKKHIPAHPSIDSKSDINGKNKINNNNNSKFPSQNANDISNYNNNDNIHMNNDKVSFNYYVR